MKNKNLVGLLAMASCVILGGCNPEPEVQITLSDLPNQVFMGEFDLAEYVTVENANSFEVALADDSQGIASVEGTKINVTGEGTVNFAVTAGGKAAEGSVTAISKIRSELVKQCAPTNDYAFYDLDEDEVSGEIYVSNYTYHNPSYMITTDWSEKVALGGLMKFNSGNVHMFEKKNITDETIDIDPGLYPIENFNLYNGEFSLVSANFVYGSRTIGEETYDYLRWAEDDNYSVASFVRYTLGIDLDEYAVTALEVYAEEEDDDTALEIGVRALVPDYMLDDEWDGETVPVDFNEEEDMVEGLVYSTYVTTDEEKLENFKDATVESAIANDEEPVSETFDELTATIDAIVDSKAFEVDYKFSLLGLNGNTEVPFANTVLGAWAAEDAVDNDLFADYPELEFYASTGYSLFTGEYSYIVNDTQTYTLESGFYVDKYVYPMNNDESGYVINDGDLYSYQFLDAETYGRYGVQEDGYYAQYAGLSGVTGLFGTEGLQSLTFESLLDETIWGDIFVSSKEVNGNDVSLEFSADTAPNVAYSIFTNAYIGKLGVSFLNSANRLQFLTCCVDLNTETNAMKVTATFDISFGAYGVYRWKAEAEFKDIGTATVPSLVIDYDLFGQQA